MSRIYQTAKRDANEREMVEAWRALGALWFPQPPGAGFDGILIFKSVPHILEIKDVRQSNGRFYLTRAEMTMKQIVEAHGMAYEIITSMEEALRLVGA